MGDGEMPESPFPPMAELGVFLHQSLLALMEVGFTRDEAFQIVLAVYKSVSDSEESG
jgi:hypothetical protein